MFLAICPVTSSILCCRAERSVSFGDQLSRPSQGSGVVQVTTAVRAASTAAPSSERLLPPPLAQMAGKLASAGGSGGGSPTAGSRAAADVPVPRLPLVPGVRSTAYGDRGEGKKSDWQAGFIDQRA